MHHNIQMLIKLNFIKSISVTYDVNSSLCIVWTNKMMLIIAVH